MATSNEKSSYQSIGKGVFRVGGTVSRSAVTGRYVTSESPQSKSTSAAFRIAESSRSSSARK